MNMRNFRKLIAAVLSAALVLTSMTAVFAADSAPVANADKALTLKDLGLYAGTDATNVAAGLDGALTTQDSLIFLAKLFGYFESASALADDQVAEDLAKFDDASSISEYAKKVVAYSADNGILNGIAKDNKLFVGAKDTVTAARFATFMLKQMGYSVPDYKQSVAKLAETRGSKIDATLTGDLTRDDAVGIMYGALTAEKASGKTVIADIVGDNSHLKAMAEKAGLIVSRTSGGGGGIQELSVESVKALNTKQVEIRFNIEMDNNSAQNKANYEIKDKGSVVKTLTNTSCKLGDDKRTVTITLDGEVQDCLTNESKAIVIVSKDIMAADERRLGVDKEVEIEVKDGFLPTVKEVKATGEKNIKITFTEPVYEGNNNTRTLSDKHFAVKSGTFTYSIQKAELDLDVINLEVGTNLIEGPVTVTVNDAGLSGDAIQDYAGYKVFRGDHTFNYVKDTSVPVVTVKSAKVNEVVLHFSKPVKGSNIKLYHSEKGAEAYASEATTTGYVDEVKFSFDEPLPFGNNILYLVNSEIESEKIIGWYGIKVPDQTLTCNVEGDTIAPVVIGCKVNKDESIIIDFNEVLDEDVAFDSDSYVVKRLSDNNEIPFSVVVNANSMRSVELIFEVKLDDNTKYQLIVKKYKDIYGNMNASDYEFFFTTGDNKNPRVMDKPEDDERCYAKAEQGKIFIIYSEPMNEAQMLDKNNYMVSIGQGGYKELGANDTITKVNDRKVEIYVKALKDQNDSTIRPYVKIAPIMDLANKRLYGSVDSYIVESIESENVAIEEAQLIAKNKIKVVFNKKMQIFESSDIELTNLKTPGSINIVSLESETTNSYGKTEVVLILDKDLPTDGRDEAGTLIGITTIDNPSSKSEWGGKLRPQFGINLDDKVAPELIMWNHDNDGSTADIPKVIAGGDIANPQVYNQAYTVSKDTIGSITIFFSEVIDESNLTKQTFEVDGFTITEIVASAETKTIILTVIADADNTPVEITVTQASEIYDMAGNALAPGSTWEVTLENGPALQ